MRATHLSIASLLAIATIPSTLAGTVRFIEASRSVSVTIEPDCAACQPPVTSTEFGLFGGQVLAPPQVASAQGVQSTAITPNVFIGGYGMANVISADTGLDVMAKSALDVRFVVTGVATVAIGGTIYLVESEEAAANSSVRLERIDGEVVFEAIAPGSRSPEGPGALVLDETIVLGSGEYRLLFDASTITYQWPFAGPGYAQYTVSAAFSTGSPGCPADLDGSGAVDGGDLGLLLIAFAEANPGCDLTEDGVTDSADLGILLGAWGACAG